MYAPNQHHNFGSLDDRTNNIIASILIDQVAPSIFIPSITKGTYE